MNIQAVIGDVHGCADEYSDLLDIIEKDFPTAQITQAGDLIHKGPESLACIHITQERTNRLILGNHELKQIRWNDWETSITSGLVTENPMKHVEEYGSLGLTKKEYNWLENQGLLYYQSIDKQPFIVVHAGISPRIKRLPDPHYFSLDKQDQKFFKSITMTRFVDSQGHMVSLGKEKPSDNWWADIYDGRFGHAIYGHQHYFSDVPITHEHATGIDLSCVYGGYLTSVILHNGIITDVIKVKARKQYKEPLRIEKCSQT